MKRQQHIALALLALVLMLVINGLLQVSVLTLHRSLSTRAKAHSITISLSQEEWANLPRLRRDEVMLRGHRFDIEHAEHRNGHVVVNGHFDQKEESLLSQLGGGHQKSQHPVPFYFCFVQPLQPIQVPAGFLPHETFTDHYVCALFALPAGVELPPPDQRL